MKKNTTRILVMLMAVLFTGVVNAQSANDYRSAGNGDWGTLSTWEVYDGVAWIAATLVPNDDGAGIVTIRNGHTVTQATIDHPVDQLVVETGGILVINASTVVSDGTGIDLAVNGDIQVNAACLCGVSTATINLNNTATWNAGTMQAGTITNAGTLTLTGGVVNIQETALSNSGTVEVESASFNFTGTNPSTITNNATSVINFHTVLTVGAATSTATINNNGSIGFFGVAVTTALNIDYNNTGETLLFSGATFDCAGAFNNSGFIRGVGALILSGTAVNTGDISPGFSTAILSVSANPYSGGNLDIELQDGTGPGTGHDQLQVIGAADLTGVTLNLSQIGTVPPGSYVILTSTLGVTGPFLAVNGLPAGYTVQYNANNVTLVVVALPVKWVSFSGKYQNNRSVLNWITASESNSDYFSIEHSLDGRVYASVGRVEASGNTSSNTSYQFTHVDPSNTKANYYRLKQFDDDGRYIYSPVIKLDPNSADVFRVTIAPNPVKDVLNLNIEGVKGKETMQFEILNASGMLVHRENLEVSGSSMIRTIPRPAISSGIYFYRLIRSATGDVTSGRVVFEGSY